MATLVQSHILPHPFPRDHPPVPLTLPPSPIPELAPLASQHHTSEYNRLKFGLQGCPIRYLPLSIHLPDFFLELQQRQIQCAKAKSWWPCKRVAASSPSPVILGSRGALPQDSDTTHLQEEIEAAIAAPLDNTPRPVDPPSTTICSHSVKTSSTHPINISFIIPHELIPHISSHLLFRNSSSTSPTVFDIPPSFSLDRLLTSLSTHCPARAHIYSAPVPSFRPQLVVKHLRTRSRVSEALQAAISSNLSAPNPPTGVKKNKQSPSFIPPSPLRILRTASTDILPSKKPSTMYHPNPSSISLSLSLTIADTDAASANVVPKKASESNPPASNLLAESQTLSKDTLSATSTPPPSLIGNLFLSSCPGKKVRLQGPVKGRSGVCRDLDTDLKRMKNLGVGCIICCLDDSELEFLGAPWTEYEALATANGIDVLRVPIPEGLAPLSPASLDDELTKIINAYTLHGIPVLVHCRGGVGRAGVVACCWLIRLGLCGWVESERAFFPPASNEAKVPPAQCVPGLNLSAAGLRRDTVQFVEQVITVVRRRRSLKAIETYEQVQFLVDYVEYLRGKEVHNKELDAIPGCL